MKQNMLKNKAAGFYVSLIAVVLCVVSAAIYGINFSTIQYKEPIFNVTVCILLAAAALVAVVMLFVDKLASFAPVLLCVGSGVALMMFVQVIIWPVSDTIYGIEPFTHMSELIMCAVFLVLSFLVSEIALYMKKIKSLT